MSDSDEYLYDSDEGATNNTDNDSNGSGMDDGDDADIELCTFWRQTGRRRRIQLLHLSSSCSLSSWMMSERRGRAGGHLDWEEVGSGYFRALFEIVLAQLRPQISRDARVSHAAPRIFTPCHAERAPASYFGNPSQIAHGKQGV